ncbi:hypothetical protein FB451DRAFT_1259254 [Mycena latifolia]|nr:hypothetical protein FB451DRAFT_1281051 [Mycena latifolia]KAJ7467733.1 hypothetical protein FB451DRAFT_1259254 [Mycena latifolia]
MPIFNGELVVFSDAVPELYLHEYIKAGGPLAKTAAEVRNSVLHICDDRFDAEFIAIWYNETFRVVNKRYIFDAVTQGHRPPEEMYSWGVDKIHYIVATHTMLRWTAYLRAPESESREVEPTTVKSRDILAGRAEGFGGSRSLTPAPSLRR